MSEETSFATTAEQFELFKNECLKWIDFWGLKDWEIVFIHENLKDCLAQCGTNYLGCIGSLSLGKNPKEKITDKLIKRLAFHEVVELLVSDLAKMASSKFVTEDEIEKNRHILIRRLENGIFKKENKNENI